MAAGRGGTQQQPDPSSDHRVSLPTFEGRADMRRQRATLAPGRSHPYSSAQQRKRQTFNSRQQRLCASDV